MHWHLQGMEVDVDLHHRRKKKERKEREKESFFSCRFFYDADLCQRLCFSPVAWGFEECDEVREWREKTPENGRKKRSRNSDAPKSCLFPDSYLQTTYTSFRILTMIPTVLLYYTRWFPPTLKVSVDGSHAVIDRILTSHAFVAFSIRSFCQKSIDQRWVIIWRFFVKIDFRG